MLGIACDPNVYPLKDPFGPMRGPFSIRERCFMGKNLDSYSYEYILEFFKKYKDSLKYSYNEILSGNYIITFRAKYSDNILLNFIKELEEQKILDDTLVLFFGDHG